MIPHYTRKHAWYAHIKDDLDDGLFDVEAQQ